jgi:hypothetical protein
MTRANIHQVPRKVCDPDDSLDAPTQTSMGIGENMTINGLDFKPTQSTMQRSVWGNFTQTCEHKDKLNAYMS